MEPATSPASRPSTPLRRTHPEALISTLTHLFVRHALCAHRYRLILSSQPGAVTAPNK